MMSRIGIKVSLSIVLALMFALVAMAQSTYTSTPNATINSGATTQDSIVITDNVIITDVQIVVNIAHSHGGDLSIDLLYQGAGPGTNVTLLNGLNLGNYLHGCGADAINATFSDAAAARMDNFDCSDDFDKPVTGAWRPTNALAALDGQSSLGTWTLRVNDRLPSDDGTLVSWSVVLNAGDTPVISDGGAPVIGGREAPLCGDFDGSTNTVVRAIFPAGAEDLYCRIIAQNERFILGAQELGNEAVLNQGVIQAVDIYSLVGEGNAIGSQVCLEGRGSVIFMDAANAPRIPSWVRSYTRGDYTCGRVNNVGTVVLVERGPNGEVAENDTDDDETTTSSAVVGATFADTVWSGTPLEGCDAITQDILNLRTTPATDGRVIMLVPYGLTLDVQAVSGDWYRVIYLEGQGWLHKDYLNLRGTCEVED